jgi:hypothetical protein
MSASRVCRFGVLCFSDIPLPPTGSQTCHKEEQRLQHAFCAARLIQGSLGERLARPCGRRRSALSSTQHNAPGVPQAGMIAEPVRIHHDGHEEHEGQKGAREGVRLPSAGFAALPVTSMLRREWPHLMVSCSGQKDPDPGGPGWMGHPDFPRTIRSRLRLDGGGRGWYNELGESGSRVDAGIAGSRQAHGIGDPTDGDDSIRG